MSSFGHDTHVASPPVIPITVWPRQRAWSYSAVQQHDKCPLAFRYRRIDRLPEPEGAPLTRGKDIHAAMEQYLSAGTIPADEPETRKIVLAWQTALDDLRTRGAQSEQQIAFNEQWQMVEWFANDAWMRVVLDAVIFGDDFVEVVEFKTGKRYDEHARQLRLYTLAGLLLKPEAKVATARIFYLDETEEAPRPGHALTRRGVPRLQEEFLRFSAKLLHDDLYPAKPGPHCRWCHFRRSNAGKCAYG